MQTIRLGLALDGQTGWQVRDAVGQATLGPMAMLTALETQLGLLRLPVPQAERVLQMRRCLQLTATGQRFYERSLAIDEVRVHGVPDTADRRMPMRDGFRLEVVVAS